MEREPVRIFGYPVTAVLAITVALAAAEATDWRGAVIAALTALAAGWKGTETLRANVYAPATTDQLVADTKAAAEAAVALAVPPERPWPPSPGNPPIHGSAGA
jgi:hypothetical protein